MRSDRHPTHPVIDTVMPVALLCVLGLMIVVTVLVPDVLVIVA